MRVIEPTFEFIEEVDGIKLLKKIELAKRVCYQSEDRITDDSYLASAAGLIARGHEAMLEHASVSVMLTIDRGVANEITRHRLASFAQSSTRFCVAGDSVLTFKNPHVRMNMEQLYKKRVENKAGQWKRLKIRQYDEQTKVISYSCVNDVFYNGKRTCIEIKTKLGYKIKCTEDHVIYTPSGEIEAGMLKIGDCVFVNGTSELYKNKDWLYEQNITLNKTFVQISGEFGFGVSSLKKWARVHGLPAKGTGYFNVGKKPWNAGLRQDDDERIAHSVKEMLKYPNYSKRKGCGCSKEVTTRYQRYLKNSCLVCKSRDGLEVHHVDKNHANNHPENLVTLCAPCHLRVHSNNLITMYGDIITSIDPCGELDVYDVEMKSEFHNYVANGFLVHNCNYSQDKFGNEITAIRPCFFKEGTVTYDEWYEACAFAEQKYFSLLALGMKPEEARDVLPISTMTRLVMTANLREWRHFFKLRAAGTTGKPHPQMLQVTVPLLNDFKRRIPVVFDDLVVEEAKK